MKAIIALLYGASKFDHAYGAEGWSWVLVILIALVAIAAIAAIPTIIAKCFFNRSNEACGKIFFGTAAVCLISCLVF